MEFKALDFEGLTKTQLYEILRSRNEIFIVRQGMNCQDLDGEDYSCRHIFYEDNGRVTAYMRAIFADKEKGIVKLGRVLTLNHGEGLGRRLFEESFPYLKNEMGCRKIYIHSQKQAVGFYEKLGFKSVSGEFSEENVIHIAMEKEI